jgi:hypothetical protein
MIALKNIPRAWNLAKSFMWSSFHSSRSTRGIRLAKTRQSRIQKLPANLNMKHKTRRHERIFGVLGGIRA